MNRLTAVCSVEVKLSAVIGRDDTKHLRWLREQLGDRLLDAAVLSTGTSAYRDADGIAIVPLALDGVNGPIDAHSDSG